jgi:SAM-dependent MidA family methyltransferase
MDYFYDNNAVVYDILSQKDFLTALHVETRLHRLLRTVEQSDIKQNMIQGVQKLINPTEMGNRFKFLFVSHTQSELYPFTRYYKP